MKFIETLKLAAAAIWAHKLRSALTLLGMIIGVAAVVIVYSAIQGFNNYIDEKIAGIGAKSYTIGRFGFDDFKDQDTIAAAQRRNKELDFDDYEFLRTRLTLTDKLGAGGRPDTAQIKRGNEIIESVGVDGTMAIVGDIQNVDVADGRYFTETEDNTAALVAGGIVVMNIMLVSVTERTKEIGIRKALGARQSDILKQFLVEAVVLSAIGGAVGVSIAWLLGRIVTAMLIPTYLSIGAIIIAVSVSGAIGIAAGLFPAWKAARLDPIEALRAD